MTNGGRGSDVTGSEGGRVLVKGSGELLYLELVIPW